MRDTNDFIVSRLCIQSVAVSVRSGGKATPCSSGYSGLGQCGSGRGLSTRLAAVSVALAFPAAEDVFHLHVAEAAPDRQTIQPHSSVCGGLSTTRRGRVPEWRSLAVANRARCSLPCQSSFIGVLRQGRGFPRSGEWREEPHGRRLTEGIVTAISRPGREPAPSESTEPPVSRYAVGHAAECFRIPRKRHHH
jgi:hypothetical protein